MHRLLPAFPPSRNRNTFIERYGWGDTPEVTMRWTRTDLNFKGRPRTSAKKLFSFRSLRRRKPDRHGKPSSVCRARPPNNDFQSSIYRRDLIAFLVWFLFHRMFTFVQTDSSSFSTRSDYPGIIILWILKLQPTRSRSLEILVLRRLFFAGALDEVCNVTYEWSLKGKTIV